MRKLGGGRKKMKMEWLKNNGKYLLLFTIVFFLILGVGIFTVNVVGDNIQSRHIMHSESVVVDKYIKVNDKWKYGKLYYKKDGAWVYTKGNYIKY